MPAPCSSPRAANAASDSDVRFERGAGTGSLCSRRRLKQGGVPQEPSA